MYDVVVCKHCGEIIEELDWYWPKWNNETKGISRLEQVILWTARTGNEPDFICEAKDRFFHEPEE